jgi:DNA-binding PadR family transcriptional regulator
MSSIRLLILGVLKRKEPIHGYEVRHELEVWGADKWANVAYGSIYSALNKMAEEGLLQATTVAQGQGKTSARTEYKLTERGTLEYNRLLREYWWEWKPAVDPFQVAVTYMNDMPHDELLAALHHRANLLRSNLSSFDYMLAGKMSDPSTPRHIAAQLQLFAEYWKTDVHWLEDIIKKVEQGELP